MQGEHKLLTSYTLTKQAARSSETSAKLLPEYEVSYSTRQISSNFKIICIFGMFLFRKDHAEVLVPRPRIWLFASSVLQQPKEGITLKNLLVTRVIKMTWKREFQPHPKIILQYLRIAVISLSYLLTYSMVQRPSWAANWFAAGQEIPRISRNPKAHYRTHKRTPPVSILGQPNPVHMPTSHLLQIHPNIIHPSTPRSPQWSPSLRFPHLVYRP